MTLYVVCKCMPCGHVCACGYFCPPCSSITSLIQV